jgi:hypothetical protein
MTIKQKIALVEQAVADHNRLDAEWTKATAVFGTHDNPLFEATWSMFDHYISLIETQIGDSFAWLHWFIHDNKCGENAFTVKPRKGAKERAVKTAAQLVAVIEASNKK